MLGIMLLISTEDIDRNSINCLFLYFLYKLAIYGLDTTM